MHYLHVTLEHHIHMREYMGFICESLLYMQPCHACVHVLVGTYLISYLIYRQRYEHIGLHIYVYAKVVWCVDGHFLQCVHVRGARYEWHSPLPFFVLRYTQPPRQPKVTKNTPLKVVREFEIQKSI